MKQFIVLSATLPFLLLFVMQISYEGRNQIQAMMIYDAIDVFKVELTEEGYLSTKTSKKLRERIGLITDIDPSRIEIKSNKNIEYPENDLGGKSLIAYEIKIPLDQVMLGTSFLNISRENNSGQYVVKGEILVDREKVKKERGEE